MPTNFDVKSSLVSAFICALVFMLAIGAPMISWLRNKQWRKDAESWTPREDTPDTHKVKVGTPSMGGLGIIGATLVANYTVFVWICYLASSQAQSASGELKVAISSLIVASSILPVFFLLHGLIGFIDDWSKATGRGGLRARSKFAAQILIAVAFVVFYLAMAKGEVGVPSVLRSYPRFEALSGPLSFAFIIGILVLALVGTGNAANLTDGIDGLATGLTVITALALCWVGLSTPENVSLFLLFPAALAGGCLGFLWFNKYKAQVFMGDTGSLALGAAIAIAAVLLRAVWLLPFICFVFYVEAASVTAQVIWFKWTRKRTGEGKRLLRRAPLHHHYELGGWSEWRVVATFWGVNLVTTIAGLMLWQAGVIPRWP